MKKLLVFVFGLIVLAAVGVAIYVATIDWNKHKNVIAEQFNLSTGKKIVFAGPVSFNVFPKPYLEASNVKILNAGFDDMPLVEIPSLVANLSLFSLLEGKFDVQRMSLHNPKINVELLPDGKLNWQSELTPEQRRNIENAKFTLNSVNLQNATVNYDDQMRDIGFKLESLNGEVSAQSVMGPYRFEGNYVKDNNPEGFAISMGKLSESMATTLNMVITHPMSESYVRFDGSFMINNKVMSGNLIVEAKKLRQFIEANFKSLKIAPQYDNPLVLTSDISLNSQQLNLNNVVMKYGESQGAGTLQMPFNDGFGNGGIKPRVDAAFNFTDLDLTPFADSLRQFIEEKYEGKSEYAPQWPLDMLVDVKSLRTFYNGQQIKNFEFSADMVSNVFTINNLIATVPGDANVKLKGTISSVDDELFYDISSSLTANDFLKTLNWLKINPTVSAASTYRKANIEAALSGTMKQIYIKPLVLSVDKTTITGEAGIKLGERNDVMATLNTDMINFDNYIPNLPAEEKEKPWKNRILYRFSELGWLNNFDLQLTTNINLAIYENTPFEKIDAKFNLLDGKMRLEKMQISSVAGASLDVSGEISGFGAALKFNELNYDVKTKNLENLINKLELDAPNIDYSKNSDFSMQGAMSGDLEKYATQVRLNLGKMLLNYSGQVDKSSGKNQYYGEVEFKHPDFVEMLESLKVGYLPAAENLGAINWKSNIEGDVDNIKAQNLFVNIGFSNFNGGLSYVASDTGLPQIKTNMEINKLELDRFMPKNIEIKSQSVLNLEATKGDVEFLSKPIWSKKNINYDVFQKFNLDGVFKVSEFVVQKYTIDNVEANVVLNSGVLEILNYKGQYLGADVETNLKLQMRDNPLVDIDLKLKNMEISKIRPVGEVYGIGTGKLDIYANVNGGADSEASFWQTLKGEVSFSFSDIAVKGWNLQAIYDDIVKRENTAGLNSEVTGKLKVGNSEFAKFEGKLLVDKGIMQLNDVKMVGENKIIVLKGDVSPFVWDMDVGFSVKYDEPKYLPSFEFSLKGPIDKPVLEVNTDALFEFYKSKEDKKQADIDTQKNAELMRLKGVAAEYYKVADALISDIRNNFEREITDAQLKVFSDDANAKYAKLLQKTGIVVNNLARNLSLAQEPDINDEILKKIATINSENTAEVEKLRLEFAKIKVLDAKAQMRSLYEGVVKKYNQAKVYEQSYNELSDKYAKRLADIVTEFTMSEDVNIIAWQNFIEDKIKAFANEDVKLLDNMQNIQNENNFEIIRSYIEKLKDLNNILDTDLKSFSESLVEYEDYTEKKVAAQEEAYAKSLRQEEVERKLEENTGSISIKKSGKVYTVRRSIEDIEKAEEQSVGEVVKVLDFSKSSNNEIPTNSANKNVVKKGRAIAY